MTSLVSLTFETLELFGTLKGDLLPSHLFSTLQTISYQLQIHPVSPQQQQLKSILSENNHQIVPRSDNHGQLIFSFKIEKSDSFSSPSESKTKLNQKINPSDIQKEIISQAGILVRIILTLSQTTKDARRMLIEKQHNHIPQLLQLKKVQKLLKSLKNKVTKYQDGQSQSNNPEREKNKQKDRKKKGFNSSSCSARSLLTEKLKNLPQGSEENDFQYVGDKVIVKSSWIMKEMKRKESNQYATQPLLYMCNQSGQPDKIIKSYQHEPLTLTHSRSQKPLSSRRSILKEMSLPSEHHIAQRKSKNDSMGCSRCDIY